MMHSKWASGNPVFEVGCSSIRLSGSQGLWFSQNCNEENRVICAKLVHSVTEFIQPGLLHTTTSTSEGNTKTNLKETLLTSTATIMNHITTQTTWPNGGLMLHLLIIFIKSFYNIIITWHTNDKNFMILAGASNERTDWVIPVIVIISCLVVAAVCITVVIIFRRKNVKKKQHKQ